MKVLLVNGSPHENGTTRRALDEIAKTLTQEGIESEIFWLGRKPIMSCTACGGCTKTGRCVYDDVVNRFLEKADSSDGFIFGSPVHYGGASGMITAFMDRVFFHKSQNYYMKPAAAIVAARRGGCSATWDQLNKYFGLASMPIVTSQYWNMLHGAVAEDAEQDAEGLQTMRTLGRNMAFILKCFAAGREKGLQIPEEEPRQNTNFIH